MSEKRIAELENRVAQLRTECATKDIHIGRLAEQLSQRSATIVTPRMVDRAEIDELETLREEKKKLVKMVEKLFALVEKSEKMRQHALMLKHVDIIEDQLHELLARKNKTTV